LKEFAMKELERIKWFLWNGNVFQALKSAEGLSFELEASPSLKGRKLLKTLGEFETHIRNNRGLIPNYGERRPHGEAISTAFVESTVNQMVSKRMVKKQQMRWSQQGDHLLLQVRTRVLNEELRSFFQRWYPAFAREERGGYQEAA
jgi:hypothetical protein